MIISWYLQGERQEDESVNAKEETIRKQEEGLKSR
jgi:hypothetical protein